MRLKSSTWRTLAALTLTLATVPTAHAASLTFEEALKLALARSLEAQRAALAIEQATVDRAFVDYETDPRATLSGTLSTRWGTASAASANALRPGTATRAEIELANPFDDWRYTKDQYYGAQVAATLYDFGRNAARAAQADAVVASRTLAADEVREGLRFKVGRAYATAVSAERVAAITRDQINVAEAKLGLQKKNYQRGLRPESDVVTAEVEVGRARIAQESADASARTARVNLARLIGLEEGVGSVILPPPSAAADAKAIARAVEKLGPEQTPAAVRRRARERDALGFDRQALDAAKKPSVTGSVGFTESGPLAWRPALQPQLATQLGMTWDIPWNGMQRDEERRLALRSKDLDLLDQIDARARADKEAVARTTMVTAGRQWAALAGQLELLERQRRLVQSRYEQGKASAIELGQTEADLVNLRLEQARLAAAELQAALDVAEARAVTDLGILFR